VPDNDLEALASYCQTLRQVYVSTGSYGADYWRTVPRDGGDDLVCTMVHDPGDFD